MDTALLGWKCAVSSQASRHFFFCLNKQIHCFCRILNYILMSAHNLLLPNMNFVDFNWIRRMCPKVCQIVRKQCHRCPNDDTCSCVESQGTNTMPTSSLHALNMIAEFTRMKYRKMNTYVLYLSSIRLDYDFNRQETFSLPLLHGPKLEHNQM